MPISLGNAPLPNGDPIARMPRPEVQNDRLAGFLTDVWFDYLNRLVGQVNASPFVANTGIVQTQAASISATDVSGGGLTAGYYRLSYYLRVTQAAGTSSSISITFAWTESGVSLSLAGTALTGNTVTTVQSNSIVVLIDAGSPVTYATTYASAGAPVMQYRLSVILEELVA